MAKRFTDTDKWKREWFTELPLKAKLVWIYILDNCDHTGVWPANFKLMSFQLGISVKASDFDSWFAEKVRLIDDDKYFIQSFIEFQYGTLSPSNRAHKAVIELIEKLGPSKDLNSSILGAQDKDKDKDNVLRTNFGEKLHRIAALWNTHCGPLPKVREMTKGRVKRCRDEDHRSDEEITSAIQFMAKSEFHIGKNDRNWRASFDYFMRQEKLVEAIENAQKKPSDNRISPGVVW